MKLLTVPSSGSIAGTTYSHNRFGQYTRSRVTPVNYAGSGRRAIVRGYLSTSAAAWATLTDQQRGAWSGYAAARPSTDRLGSRQVLSGFAIYQSINCERLNVGLSLATLPPSSDDVWVVSITAYLIHRATGALYTNWAAGPSGSYLCRAFSPPRSAGVSYNSRFWQMNVVSATLGSATGYSLYIAEFGTPAAGSRVFTRLTPVNAHGVRGLPVVASCIVT